MPVPSTASPLAPLPEPKLDLLARLVDGLDSAALTWLSGYAAGLAVQPGSGALRGLPGRESLPQQRLSVVYGSQTGNAKRLATQLARDAERGGLAVRLLRADAYPVRELKSERLLIVVISTQGDGDPPDDARGLIDFIASKRAPTLDGLKYAVLGLGDSSYPKFCAVGQMLDARLADLSATRLIARADADLDIESVATPWLERALGAAREALKAGAPGLATVTPLRAVAAPAVGSREKPYAAEVLLNQRITARQSTRDIRHVELALEGSGLSYEPGDALGVWPRNPPAVVEAVLQTLRLDGKHAVSHNGETLALAVWLGEKRELTRLPRPFVALHAAQARSAELNRLLAPDRSPELAELLTSHQPLDLLRAYPAEWGAEELVAALRPLVPRLYSIASSQKVVGAEAHLTVAHVAYEAFGIEHWGAASHQLATLDEGGRVPIFMEANERFRLPAAGARDIIMIGPGTGVAPFRGFLQDRVATGATGRNWLLFGNPHFSSDFLYQLEWQEALRNGTLHRLDLAFSRDQVEKIYVQQRLLAAGRELFDWIENGAQLYVCGDATRMAKDVHAALRDVIVRHGGKSAEDADEYLNQLLADGRYARDTY
jgi:sulfite reductase (NADPH) flavoprotein alpha-component